MRKSTPANAPSRMTQILCSVLVTLFCPPPVFSGDSAAPAGLYEFGDFALYLPEEVPTVRAILLVLGGPDTRAFLSDGEFGAPIPELEASLHILGQELRALALEQRLAMLGTTLQGAEELPDQPRTDALIFTTIAEAARISGHPELVEAPILLYGISGGTPQAIGFTARNPGRVGALLLKVPAPPEPLSNAAALAVPTYMILAGRDTFVDNEAVVTVFDFNRRAGGLWAVAMQPGVPHHTLTPNQRAVTVNWLRAIVALRLGSSAQDPLRDVPESAGWLGHPGIGVSSWAEYPADRKVANWFPSRATAEEWWEFVNGKDSH